MAVPYRKSKVPPEPVDCPLARCMRFLSGAWTINVIWYLRAGARRFSELRGDLPGISAKTLTARLRRLERDGLVHREVKPTSPPTVEYELTNLGKRLLPALEAIAQVGEELKHGRTKAVKPGP